MREDLFEQFQLKAAENGMVIQRIGEGDDLSFKLYSGSGSFQFEHKDIQNAGDVWRVKNFCKFDKDGYTYFAGTSDIIRLVKGVDKINSLDQETFDLCAVLFTSQFTSFLSNRW